MPSDAERVRDLLAPHVMGRHHASSTTLEVTALEIAERGRTFDVVVEVLAYGERWRVRLARDNSDAILFNAAPPPEVVRGVGTMVRIELFEWWDTKDRERLSAKLGERLP